MDEEDLVTFTIKDELCRRTGLTAKWINGSNLSVCAYLPLTSNLKDTTSEFVNQHDVNIFHLQPEFIYEDPILRCLIAEANSIFLTMQDIKKHGSRQDYLKISRTYRSIIRATLEKLQNAVQSGVLEEELNVRYQNYITVFYSVECVWHLCEILLIETSPSSLAITQLLEWIRFHFPAAEKSATELLLEGRDANNSKEFWPTVKGLILQGQVDVARAILQLHSLSETTAFKMAEQILRTLPLKSVTGVQSIQKYRSQWQYWLADTELKLSAGTMSSEPKLEEIVKLIIGDTITWNEEIKNSNYWYEYFPAYLFYTEPACKQFKLGTTTNLWLSRWASIKGISDSGFLKHLDRVILNLLQNDMNQVLHSIQRMCDNQWFVTHLVDLFYHSGILQLIDQQNKEESIMLRNSLLLEFGTALLSRESLWILGVDYLEHCGVDGSGALQLLLSHLPIESDKQALKIINIAKIKSIPNLEAEVCKVRAKHSVACERYGDALEWALRSNDVTMVSCVTNFLLNHYAKTGELLCPDLLANIGAKMFISSKLVFLVKYFDFHQFYKKKEFSAATELLVDLLDSKIAPEYFWSCLLIDAIPLLESKDLKMSSKDTSIILHHVESSLVPLIKKQRNILKRNPDAKLSLFKDYRIEDIEEAVKLVRLACARNMSRAIILENSVIP